MAGGIYSIVYTTTTTKVNKTICTVVLEHNTHSVKKSSEELLTTVTPYCTVYSTYNAKIV